MNSPADAIPYRILVVDDDIAHAEMVSEFLRISGYSEIDYAEDINTLWDRLEEDNYHIVLLDYKLPDGTGLEVLGQMDDRGYKIPVIMVTGQGNERVAAQAIQRGAADYLIKSGDYLFTLPTLIQKTVRAYDLHLSVQRSLEQIRYQAMLLNSVRDAVVVWDTSGKITYWNPAATALFGWSAEERIGAPVSSNYLNVFTPPIDEPVEPTSDGQHVMRKFVNREGKSIWVSSRVTPLGDSDEKGQLIGYMDVTHDITARVMAERALQASEARYRAIVEDYQTEMISRFTPDGVLTFVNEVFCRYFAKSRQELLGVNFLDFVPQLERQKVTRHLASLGPNKPTATLEHQISPSDHGVNWLQHTDRAIFDQRGRVLEFQSIGRDITKRKQMEAQIKAAQAHLIQAARMATIGETAAGVAHQIYNPLTTIIADAQIILRKMASEDPVRDSAEAIEQAGWRLQKVVQRLMEFSRPSSETLTSLAVNDTIEQSLSLVGEHIEALGIRLDVQLGESLGNVRGNARQLENLWVNLLLLARDACTAGQGHMIRVQSASGPPGTLLVEVADDGKAIPGEELATIFEPNFVGPSSGRGTGMELSICREIVRQHHGQITADSSPDHRTIIRVVLPVEEES